MPAAKKTIKVKVKVEKPKVEKEKKTIVKKTTVKKRATKVKKPTIKKSVVSPAVNKKVEAPEKEDVLINTEEGVSEEKNEQINLGDVYSESDSEKIKKEISKDINFFAGNDEFKEIVEDDAKNSDFLPPYNRKPAESFNEKDKGFLNPQKEIAQLQDDENDMNENEAGQIIPRSVGLYRKIAFSFIFLTVALLAVIFYFSFLKVTIVLIPNQERINSNMIFDVYDKDISNFVSEKSIEGIVKSEKIDYEKIYLATGSEVIGKEAIGMVKIINNYIKNQPLVASTRLLTPDGKLFRIKDTVNIPAGGSVEVEVYADEPSPEMAIGPTKFTIPGLWAGLQEKIYAENSEDIIYRQKIKKSITQEDLDNSTRDIKKELLAKAKSDISDTYKEYSQIIYKIDENSIKSSIDSKIGEEKDEFNVFMEANIAIVAFDGQKAEEMAQQKFMASLSENKELIYFDNKNIIYSLNSYDFGQGVATMNATFEGKVTLEESSNIIEIDKILGLNKKQLDAYLNALPEIAGYDVKYYPTFIKRVPKLVDRIEVEIKK